MKYAGIIENDVSAGDGICTTLFVQGCPHRCAGCHNPSTWDFNGGKEFTEETFNILNKAINANGIKRNFCIMGGEPLASRNRDTVLKIIRYIKKLNPTIDIYLWTGYYIEDLIKENDPIIIDILNNINFLIDGPYIKELRDITLRYMGSSNQRFIEMPLTFIEKNGIIYIDYKNKENNNGSDFED